MFQSFKLSLDKDFFSEDSDKICHHKYLHYLGIGENLYRENGELSMPDIDTYIDIDINTNSDIDAIILENNWFPEIEADVFLSHSHTDKDLVLAFAGYLYENFNLKCFIDSEVWGYGKTLIEKIKKVTKTKDDTVAVNINNILSVALMKAIDRAEAMFILETANSIETLDGQSRYKTYSPWIYLEMIYSNMIRRNPIGEDRKNFILCRDEETINESYLPKFVYIAKLDGNIILDKDDFIKWIKIHKDINRIYSLDALYRNKKDEIYRSEE